MSDLTEEMRRFLYGIRRYGGAATTQELPLATREQDAARKRCKRLRYAYYDEGYWRLTHAGRNAMNRTETKQTEKETLETIAQAIEKIKP